jgi:hypothetical protein
MPIDLAGQPYTPSYPRPWLNEAHRADLAIQFDCAPGEVEYRLDARERMNAKIAKRRDYEGGTPREWRF